MKLSIPRLRLVPHLQHGSTMRTSSFLRSIVIGLSLAWIVPLAAQTKPAEKRELTRLLFRDGREQQHERVLGQPAEDQYGAGTAPAPR
ncbi:MAG: hypothetical protein IPN85_01610 [Flavobacteriales bacterium]|nr:hypothetical protein [Flavobacteriales bacterium]